MHAAGITAVEIADVTPDGGKPRFMIVPSREFLARHDAEKRACDIEFQFDGVTYGTPETMERDFKFNCNIPEIHGHKNAPGPDGGKMEFLPAMNEEWRRLLFEQRSRVSTS